MSKLPFFLFLGLIACFVSAQNKPEKKTKENEIIVIKDSIQTKSVLDPLAPSKAAFYSAILPGLGQAYNKKYWKIPIVYGLIGGSFYIYLNRNDEYRRYRDAYKSRLAGFNTDEFYGIDSSGNPLTTPIVSNDALIRAQRTLRKDRDIWLFVTIVAYGLNIIDANVDAHLLQFNVDDNLSIRPHFNMNALEPKGNLGLSLDLKF